MGRGNRVQGKVSLAVCEVCGEYQEQCFEVHLGGEKHIFDSFECAIRGLLPTCSVCGRIILGSGVLVNNLLYCVYPCASPRLAPEYETYPVRREQSGS